MCDAQSRLAESEERVQELTQAVAMLKVQKVPVYRTTGCRSCLQRPQDSVGDVAPKRNLSAG